MMVVLTDERQTRDPKTTVSEGSDNMRPSEARRPTPGIDVVRHPASGPMEPVT